MLLCPEEILSTLKRTGQIAADVPLPILSAPTPDGDNLLLHAVFSKKHTALKQLLAAGVPADLPGSHQLTALAYAAQYSQPQMAKWLLDAGADVNRVFPTGERVLGMAYCPETIGVLVADPRIDLSLPVRPRAGDAITHLIWESPENLATAIRSASALPRDTEALMDQLLRHQAPVDALMAMARRCLPEDTWRMLEAIDLPGATQTLAPEVRMATWRMWLRQELAV